MKISCPKCGANIEYDAKTGKIYCQHCNSYSDISEVQQALSSNYEEYLCSSCGAELITDGLTVLSTCIYCGSHEIIKSSLSEKFLPKRIIPFSVSKEEFLKIFEEEFFDSKEQLEVHSLEGLYVPYLLYKYKITSSRTRTF